MHAIGSLRRRGIKGVIIGWIRLDRDRGSAVMSIGYYRGFGLINGSKRRHSAADQ